MLVTSIVFLILLLIALKLLASETTPPPRPDLTPGLSPVVSPEIKSTHEPYQPVRLAWFYKPPDDSSLPVLVEKFDTFILTYKDESQRDTLKSLGVTSPIYVYLQLVEIRDPGSCTETPQGNQVAFQPGDFCEIFEQHPDWFLLDQNGNRIVDRNSYYMDPGNREYQDFWLQRARALQDQFHWDGIFIDNVEASLSQLTEEGIVPANYPNDASYQTAIEGFLAYLRDNYFRPQGQSVLANIISIEDWNVWLRYLEYLDGAMIESFAVDWSNDYRSPADWEVQMAAVDRALSQNKALILVSQSEGPDPERQQFALASYLLIANEKVSFRYTDANGYQEILLFDNYALDLGKPLGSRKEKAEFLATRFQQWSCPCQSPKAYRRDKAGFLSALANIVVSCPVSWNRAHQAASQRIPVNIPLECVDAPRFPDGHAVTSRTIMSSTLFLGQEDRREE